jgi:hypothetical protein
MAKRATKTVSKTTLPARSKPVLVVDNTQSNRLIDAIIRAAADPRVKVEKMERLVALQRSMEERAAKIAFDAALAELQPELPIIDRNGSIIIRKKDPKTGERTGPIEQKTPYAKWEDIMETVRPILHKFGFALSFRTPADPQGRVAVTGILSRGGHREETTLSYQHDTTGSKNAAQAINSSTSYGQRKTACLLLNIISRGEDDDAKKSEGLERLTTAQVNLLDKLVTESGADLARFLILFGVDSLADIPQLRFNEAKAQLNRKLKDKKAREKAAKETSDFPGDKPLKTEPPKNEFR